MIPTNDLEKSHFSTKGTYLKVDFSKLYFGPHNFFANNRLDLSLRLHQDIIYLQDAAELYQN